jgi:hypothetical protein
MLNTFPGVRADLCGTLFSASLAIYLIYGRGIPNASDTGFAMNMAGMLEGLIVWSYRYQSAID